ncbi:MAG: hypothetical protein AB3N09_11485 [Tateyamaria sp.]
MTREAYASKISLIWLALFVINSLLTRNWFPHLPAGMATAAHTLAFLFAAWKVNEFSQLRRAEVVDDPMKSFLDMPYWSLFLRISVASFLAIAATILLPQLMTEILFVSAAPSTVAFMIVLLLFYLPMMTKPKSTATNNEVPQ